MQQFQQYGKRRRKFQNIMIMIMIIIIFMIMIMMMMMMMMMMIIIIVNTTYVTESYRWNNEYRAAETNDTFPLNTSLSFNIRSGGQGSQGQSLQPVKDGQVVIQTHYLSKTNETHCTLLRHT